MSNRTLRAMIGRATAAIGKRTNIVPEIGVILGTGLGGLSKAIRVSARIPYAKIPGFPRSTVTSHAGELVMGTLEGRRVAAMEGRFHYYEGYSMAQITFPVRVLRALGAKTLIVSNACGGLNPSFRKGEIMLIDDHINMMGVNPLIGLNDETLGPRFPDMCRPYDPVLLALAKRVARRTGFRVRQGVYAAWTGPCLETRAEYRFIRRIGADAVGMSTVPEVIVGVHAGFRILGVSIVTDLCDPENLHPVDIREIIATANAAEPKLTALVRGVIRGIGK